MYTIISPKVKGRLKIVGRDIVCEAIVLGRWPVGETDKRVSLLTLGYGRLLATAKGTRKAGSKMAGLTEPICHVRLRLIEGKSQWIVAQPQSASAFGNLRFKPDLLPYGLAICDLTHRALPEAQPSDEAYQLCITALNGLSVAEDPINVLAWYAWRLTATLGYRPLIGGCVVCGGALKGTDVWLDPMHGGSACGNCADKQHGFRLSKEALAELEVCMEADEVPTGLTQASALAPACRSYLRFFLEDELRVFELLPLNL